MEQGSAVARTGCGMPDRGICHAAVWTEFISVSQSTTLCASFRNDRIEHSFDFLLRRKYSFGKFHRKPGTKCLGQSNFSFHERTDVDFW
jgi:hypothetical protein